ncbi:MAG: DNA/RNA non-specific endonuclease [Stackebrandtia sp.]
MAFPPPPVPWIPPPPKRPRDTRRLRAAAKSFVVSLVLLGTLAIVVSQLPSQHGAVDDAQAREWKNASETATGAAYLALAPMLHIEGDYNLDDGEAKVDLNVSNLGSMRGEVEVAGETVKLLSSGGRSFARASESFWSDHGAPAEAVSEYGKHWVRTDPDFLGADFAKTFNPSTLSAKVYDEALTAPVKRGDVATVDGRKARAMEVSDYTAYVATEGAPEVVRLATPEGTVDVDRMPGADIDDFMDELEKKFQDLKKALDSQVSFSLDGDIVLAPCTISGCTATVTLNNSVSTSSEYVKADRSVNAAVTISMTLDGKPVGSCQKTVTMKPNGTETVKCSASYYVPPSSKPKTVTIRAEARAVARAVVKADIKAMVKDAIEESGILDSYPEPEELPVPEEGEQEEPDPGATPTPGATASGQPDGEPSSSPSDQDKKCVDGIPPTKPYNTPREPPPEDALVTEADSRDGLRATSGFACYEPGYKLSGPRTTGAKTPPGWEKGMQRGHLIAHVLGGANDVANFVPLYGNANMGAMRVQEKVAQQRIQAGNQGILYTVIPIYTVYKFIPCQIMITIKGEKDGLIAMSMVINRGTRNDKETSGCSV